MWIVERKIVNLGKLFISLKFMNNYFERHILENSKFYYTIIKYKYFYI